MYPFFKPVTVIVDNHQVSAWQCDTCHERYNQRPGISKNVLSWCLLVGIALAAIFCIVMSARNQ